MRLRQEHLVGEAREQVAVKVDEYGLYEISLKSYPDSIGTDRVEVHHGGWLATLPFMESFSRDDEPFIFQRFDDGANSSVGKVGCSGNIRF